jgi:cytidylate kinase
VTPTVAIDGPAGAGKSTLARRLAEHLGVERLDTGAMYRAVAWAALRDGIDPTDADAVGALTCRLTIEVGERVLVDGVDASVEIRTSAVDDAVSLVAAVPAVRAELVRRQREWVEQRGGGVVEGRDIGTVVLPHADLKVYLTASPIVRAGRRASERVDGNSLSQVADQLRRRDHLDSTRRDSPLPAVEDIADDALVIDSTDRSADDIVAEVVKHL